MEEIDEMDLKLNKRKMCILKLNKAKVTIETSKVKLNVWWTRRLTK
jgi:hypothetical protein